MHKLRFLRKWSLLMATAGVLSAIPVFAVQPNVAVPTLTLPSGTQIPVRLGQSLDTKRDGPGTRFIAHVAEPITHNGQVVLQRGAVVRGHLVESIDLVLLMEAKTAIEETSQYLKEYLLLAETFDGREEVYEPSTT